jgi:ribose 5-phosphate isomerase B
MTIALSTDHAGLEQIKQLQDYLEDLGHECRYYGPEKLNPADDYPDFIIPSAKAVASGECQRGIIIGGSGQGEAMAANRIKGVRCAVFYGPAVANRPVDIEGNISHSPYEIIKLSREHNDANMLSLAARFINLHQMQQAVSLWLDTEFSGQERHTRRNKKLDEAN